MSTVADMLDLVKSFDAVDAASEAMRRNAKEIIGLNTNQLYELSQDAEGKPLRSPYTPKYAARKNRLRGKFITDLYYTGDFQKKFRLDVQGGFYIITSESEHAQYAVKWANAPVYGLTVESKEEAWDIIGGDWIDIFKQHTGCK